MHHHGLISNLIGRARMEQRTSSSCYNCTRNLTKLIKLSSVGQLQNNSYFAILRISCWQPLAMKMNIIGTFSCEKNLMVVSYTHLRAHETPEHLVCRLL